MVHLLQQMPVQYVACYRQSIKHSSSLNTWTQNQPDHNRYSLFHTKMSFFQHLFSYFGACLRAGKAEKQQGLQPIR